MADHPARLVPAQLDRASSGEQRLEEAARHRHLAALAVPAPRSLPFDLPRPR